MTVTDNMESKDRNGSLSIEKVSELILAFLTEINIKCAIHAQLEVFTRHKLKDEADENVSSEIFNKTLFSLCRKGLVEAVLLEEYVKRWKMVACTAKRVRLNPRSNAHCSSKCIVIPEGCYYSWSYSPYFKNISLQKTHNRYIFDTKSLRNTNPRLFEMNLVKMADLLRESPKFKENLLWILPEGRNALHF